MLYILVHHYIAFIGIYIYIRTYSEPLFFQVKKIPESFQLDQHYFGSYIYSLLEETWAEVHSNIKAIYKTPFPEVIGFEETKPYGTKLCDIKVYVK